MSSSLWPNSATRKMYGQAGRKAKRLNREKQKYSNNLAQLSDKVIEYQKLPWYKKLWLAICQVFE